MKRLFGLILLIIVVIPACLYSEEVSWVSYNIPEYCKKYTGDTDIYTSQVTEYKDCIIIAKTLRKKDDLNQYFSFRAGFLTGKAGITPWVRLDKSKGNRDRIYNIYRLADKTVVIALITTRWPLMRNERLAVDEILKAKIKDKTVIIRYIGPGFFYQSDNTGLKTVIPSAAELVSANILRLQYSDGAVEHWRIKPSRDFIKKNTDKFGQPVLGQPDRMLRWWNGIGKGTPGQNHDLSKAWNYDPDTSKEPKYNDKPGAAVTLQSASVTSWTDKMKSIFARLATFWKHP